MNCDELQQLTALQALGALDGPDLARFSARLAHDPAAAAELARFLDVSAGLAGAVTAARPPASVRARVLAHVRANPNQPPARAEAPWPPGFRVIAHDAPWHPSPIPGARFKVLSVAPGQPYAMLLVEIGPGVAYPEHDHEGTEEMYILTGDLQTEGRSLGPGDFLHADPGSHHRELCSIGGCTALMVVPGEAVMRMAGA